MKTDVQNPLRKTDMRKYSCSSSNGEIDWCREADSWNGPESQPNLLSKGPGKEEPCLKQEVERALRLTFKAAPDYHRYTYIFSFRPSLPSSFLPSSLLPPSIHTTNERNISIHTERKKQAKLRIKVIFNWLTVFVLYPAVI